MKVVERSKPWLPQNWDREADVVIIGYGGAGACASITSHDAEVRTLILEKAPVGGGNTATAAPGFAIPTDVDKAIAYYRALTWGTVDEDLIRTLAKSFYELPKWLEKLGIKVKLAKLKPWYPSLPGADSFQNVQIPRTSQLPEHEIKRIPGHLLFSHLDNLVRKRGIEILYETPAIGLIQDPLTREIVGIRAINSAKKEVYIKAVRGVILACGGFENNRDMLTQFLPFTVALPIYPMGTPYNTGDGITMATEVGAKLWHMTSVEFGNFAPKAPGDKFGLGFRLLRQIPVGSTAIYINQYGKRFMDESVLLSHSREFFKVQHFDAGRVEFPNIPFFIVFDETFRKKGPIVERNDSWWNLMKIYEWSDDNSAEIESGWIKRANTIKQLAEKIGVPKDALQETVNEYNINCSRKNDGEFGRGKDWLLPIETPPFYATELCEPIINTQGGPKHNARAQVLDKDDNPIPRLYAAGELGSVFFPLYQPGANIPEALAFGHIAGEQAASLPPWG